MEQLRQLELAGQLVPAGQLLFPDEAGDLLRRPLRQGGLFCFDGLKEVFLHIGRLLSNLEQFLKIRRNFLFVGADSIRPLQRKLLLTPADG